MYKKSNKKRFRKQLDRSSSRLIITLKSNKKK